MKLFSRRLTPFLISRFNQYSSPSISSLRHKSSDSTVDSLTPALYALQARLGQNLPSEALLAATSHSTYKNGLYKAAHTDLKKIGTSETNKIVLQHLESSYPSMTKDQLASLVKAYCGVYAMDSLGKQMGVHHAFRYETQEEFDQGQEARFTSSVMRALLGGIYQSGGKEALEQFVKSHILTRSVDLERHLTFEAPKIELKQYLREAKLPKLTSHLLKESGRATHSPTFVVGVYSGEEKIGEGYGSSIKMAETRACKDALTKLYLKSK